MEGVGGLPFKGPDGQTQFPDYSRFFPDDGTTPVGTPTTVDGTQDTQTTADGSGGVTGPGQTGGTNHVSGAPTLSVPLFHHSHNATQTTTVNQSVVDGPAGPSYTPPANLEQIGANLTNFGAEFAALSLHIENTLSGPDQKTMKDLRLAVALALEDLQRAIQDASVTTSEQATKTSQGQMEATEHKLQMQQAQWKEINDQLAAAAAKKDSLATRVGKIFGAIFAVIAAVFVTLILVCIPVLGWAAIAFLWIAIVDMCQKIGGQTDNTALQKLTGAITTASDNLAKWQYEQDNGPEPSPNDPNFSTWEAGLRRKQERYEIAAVVMTVVLMSIACPAVLILNPSAFTDFLTASPMMTDAYALRHGGNIDPAEVAKENMILSITLTCIAMVAGIVISLVMPTMIASQVNEVAQIAKQATSIADMVIDAANVQSKMAQVVLRIVLNPQLYINATQTTLNTISGFNEIAYDKIMATVTQMQGELDSATEQSDAEIAVLKKIIQKLLDSLTGMSDQIQSIGNQLSKSTYNWTQTVMQMG